MSAAGKAMLNIPLPMRSLPSLRIDYVMLLLVSALLATGLIVLASASISIGERLHDAPFYFVARQLQAVLVGLLAAGALLIIPTNVWQRLAPMLLLFALALLLLVLVPGVGKEVNGSTRWVSLAGVSIQVSEPARLALILFFASYAVRRQEQLRTQFSGLLKPMIVLMVAAALLLAEPDFGAATVLMATTLGMLFVAGARIRDFAVFAVLGLIAMAALAISSDYRLRRLTAFLNPWADPFDSGFQLTQSLIAVGRGEWFGVGLGSSVQKLFYLPEAHTDFVFAVFAEEFGLLGAVVLIGLLFTLVARMLALSRRAADASLWFQAYAALGIATWLGLQSFINIGVNIGLLPTKGLTLPLVSYGRSSIIIVLAAVGLILRIHHETVTAQVASQTRGRRK